MNPVTLAVLKNKIIDALNAKDMDTLTEIFMGMSQETHAALDAVLSDAEKESLANFALQSITGMLTELVNGAAKAEPSSDEKESEEECDNDCPVCVDVNNILSQDTPFHAVMILKEIQDNAPAEHLLDVCTALETNHPEAFAILQRTADKMAQVSMQQSEFGAEPEVEVTPVTEATSGVSIPWEYLNPVYNWVGKDNEGKWYAFNAKPFIGKNPAGAWDLCYDEGVQVVCIDDVCPEDVNNQVPFLASIMQRPA